MTDTLADTVARLRNTLPPLVVDAIHAKAMTTVGDMDPGAVTLLGQACRVADQLDDATGQCAEIDRLKREVQNWTQLAAVLGFTGHVFYGAAPEPDRNVDAVFDLHGTRWERRYIPAVNWTGSRSGLGNRVETEVSCWVPQRYRFGVWRNTLTGRHEKWHTGPMAHGPVSTVPPRPIIR